MTGLVIKSTGSSYSVKTEGGQMLECKIRGNLRMKSIRTTNPVAVGDRVRIESNSSPALITEILERKNYIIRRSSNLSKQAHILAANLDLAALIVTVNYPETSTVFIDRFLASAEAYRIPACLVFNKTDCYDSEELEYLKGLEALYYGALEYPCFSVSALDASSLSGLRSFLQGKTTLISGNSGVGKSTLANALIPSLETKTAEISQYHNKGMHTTTFSEMFELPEGGYIIDTPGIKGFGSVDMDKAEMGHYFKEIFRFSKDCRFADCTHTHEPGCAVRSALDKSYISQSRYRSYLSMRQDEDSGKYRGS